jgi:hypothetical protein
MEATMASALNVAPIRVKIGSIEHFVIDKICQQYKVFISVDNEIVDTVTNKKIPVGYFKCVLRDDYRMFCEKENVPFDNKGVNKAIKTIFDHFSRIVHNVRVDPNACIKGQKILSERVFEDSYLEEG